MEVLSKKLPKSIYFVPERAILSMLYVGILQTMELHVVESTRSDASGVAMIRFSAKLECTDPDIIQFLWVGIIYSVWLPNFSAKMESLHIIRNRWRELSSLCRL